MASLEEWLADPAGAPVLREVVGTDETGRPRGILGDDELRAVVGNFPIGALTAFPGSGLDQGDRRRASPTVARPSRSLNAATSTTTLPRSTPTSRSKETRGSSLSIRCVTGDVPAELDPRRVAIVHRAG